MNGRFPATYTLLAMLLLSVVTPGVAQQDSVPVEIGGFINASLFYQSGRFLPDNGQTALWVKQVTKEEEGDFYGGDLRDTHLFFKVNGPKISGWRVNGRLTMDLFGGFRNSADVSGPLNFVSPRPRLVLGYVDFANERTRIRIGQANPPLYPPYIPESVSHITNPIGYGSAGVIGQYFPGLFVRHDFPIGDLRAELHGAVLQNTWKGVPDSANTNVITHTALSPQLEARFQVGSDTTTTGMRWLAFVAGHVDQKNLDEVPGKPDGEITGWAAHAGARIRTGRLTFKGAAYRGHAIAQQFAQLLQYEDVGGWGAWGQAGWNFTDRWSVWTFLGQTDLEEEALSKGPASNWTLVPMLRFETGPVAVGIEWLHAETEYLDESGTGTTAREGDWIGLSAILRF